MIHTIIFDIGGTLIGAPDLFSELSDLFSDVTVNPDVQNRLQEVFIKQYSSIGCGEVEFDYVEDIIRSTLKIISSELGCIYKSEYTKAKYYDVFVKNSFLYDDTISTLDYLKDRNIDLIVASDADAEVLYAEFERFKLNKYFSKYFISGSVEAYKPSDKFTNQLRGELKEPFNEIIIVGDSPVDILTGKKLGIKTLFKGSRDGARLEPDYIIKDLCELERII